MVSAQKPSTIIMIGAVAGGAFAAKVIQVICTHWPKIISARSNATVKKLQAESEADIARLRAETHAKLLLNGNAAMLRAEVVNPDLPEGRRLSDNHILKALPAGESTPTVGDQPGSGPTGVVPPIDQNNGVA
jgi:hypothetical protein